jgi:hypothetical protein
VTDGVVLGPVAPASARGWPQTWRACRLGTLALVLLAAAFSSPAPTWVPLPWPGSVLDVACYLALLVLAVDLWARGWVRPPWILISLGVVSGILAAASAAWSTNPAASWVYAGDSVEGLVLVWMVVAVTRGESARLVVWAIGLWVVALLVPCALMWAGVRGFQPPAWLDPESGDYISYFARLSHPWIGRSNNPATLFVVAVVPLAAWGVRHRARFAQVLASVALVATVMTVSRGTLLALAAGAVFLAIVAWPLARSLRRWALAALGASVVALVLMYLLNPASRMHLSSRASATNVDARFVLVSDALADIGRAPWRGTGPSVTPSVHNVLLQQLVDFGVVGGLVVDVLLVAVVVWWFRGPRRRGPAGWLAVACGVGIAVQLGSCLVEASYEGGFLRTLMWLSWGLLLALYAREGHAEEHRSPSSGTRVTRPGPAASPRPPRPRGPRRRASGTAAARGS